MKKQKIVLTDYKTYKFIVKTLQNTQETHFQKIGLYLKKIIKEKSKCAICFTERTFIHEIEDMRSRK